MKKEPKILEEGESAYKNGGDGMCGGVIDKSTFDSAPWAYLMAFVMDDDKFEIYKKLEDRKEAEKWFDKYAHSMI